MNNYKPFWQNKPITRKVFAAVVMLLGPILVPMAYLIMHWQAVCEVVADTYKDLWAIMTGAGDE